MKSYPFYHCNELSKRLCRAGRVFETRRIFKLRFLPAALRVSQSLHPPYKDFMAVNLPPQYHDAEARYKKGRTPEERLAGLREMWVILPKHKASEKVQAELKTKICELTDEIEQAKSGPKKAAPGSYKIPKQGAGQIVFVGPPNAGKSLLLSKLTKATPAVAPYPFTTREPIPGMMDVEDVRSAIG